MIFELFYFLIAFSCGLLACYLLFTVVFKGGSAPASLAAKSFPGVTILKPMKNIDDGLEDNLVSFFTLDYPDYRIIFGVDTYEDACVTVIERIKKLYPRVNASVVQTGTTGSVNPKIDKLAKMSREDTAPLFWVSDSNTRVGRETLKLLVLEYMNNDSKIVFSPIRGTGLGTLGSIMANSYLNLFVSGSILGSWVLFSKPIIVGKSMLVEAKALNKLGGFSAFSSYLAEDYMMGEIYKENGIYISTNCTWVENFSSSTSIRTFYSRMSRWAKMRRRIDPFFYSLEILANPLALAFVSIFFLGWRGVGFFAAAFVFKLAVEYASLFLVNKADTADSRVLAYYPLCVLIKDAILFRVYIDSFFSKTVKWHGKKITIGSKSTISALHAPEGKNEKQR